VSPAQPGERVTPAQPGERVVAAGDVAAAPLHVVLVEPEIPPNTGNVARLCAATGCALHLIEPLGFRIDDRALKRAGLDYWHAVALVVHPSLDAFLATFAPERCWWIETTGAQSYTSAAFARGDALVFGKETGALPAAVLERYAARTLRIPMRDDAVRSINLSSAAGIVTYAALAALEFPGLR
jgi:tRNA (cytidine/uridine-2'-O-)-methyltransferase